MFTQNSSEKNSSAQSRLSHNHRDSKPKQRSSTVGPRLLFLVILSVTVGIPVGTADRKGTHRQRVPLVTLQSSERILEDVPFISAVTSVSSTDGKEIFILRRDTPNLIVYDVERKRSNEVATYSRTSKAMAIGTQNRVYLASESAVRIIDATGRSPGTFPIPNPGSLAVTANGDVAVSSTGAGKLIHLYDQTGSPLRQMGELKRFDPSNPAQNNFLNGGKVLSGSSGALYYVSTFAPTPTVQKFSPEGKLLLEFAIEGNAVDLQTEHAREFLRSKKAETVGGFHVITAAAIDPATGHLWIGLNGSSIHGSVSPGSGVAYEYDPDGVKLAEYAFLLNAPLTPAGIITDVRDMAVSAPWIYVLTSQGHVYRFNMNDRFARQHRERKKERQGTVASAVSSFWSTVFAPPSAMTQTPTCPAEQPFTCLANCPSGSSPATQDCASEIRKRLTAGDRIISNSCNINPATPGGCSGGATACNTGTGVQISLSVTLNCNPAPTPTPASGGGGSGCGLTFDGGGSNPCECNPDAPDCVSPILIDVAGNGFQLSSANAGVDFDIRAAGAPQRISWTAPFSDDAWLALDRNGNGIIDDGSELFGNFTPQPNPPGGQERNGFLALAEYDKPANGGNGDALITPSDAVFASLRLWQDRNHNGISEAAELIGLQTASLKTLELDYKVAKKEDEFGNYFRYRAKVKAEQGAQVNRWAWDVFLVTR